MTPIVAGAAAQATLGVLVGRMIPRLNAVIDNAGLQGNLALIQTGRQVSLALDQFSVVYSNLLQQTANQVHQTVIQELQVIDTAITSMTNQVGAQIQQMGAVAGQVQMVVHALANAFALQQLPQVRRMTFSYTTSGLVELRFIGDFPLAAATGMAPTLEVENSGAYPHAGNANNLIRFLVPLSSLFANHTIQHVTLKVPVTAGWMWMLNPWNWFFSTPTHNFRGYMHKPPVNPGQVTVGWAMQVPQIVTQTIPGPVEYIQSSGAHWGHENHAGHGPNTAGHVIHHREAGPQHRPNRPYSVKGTTGWTVIGGHVHIFDRRPENYNNITAPAISLNSVSILVSTRNTGHGRSEGVWFRIDRDEQQTQMQQQQQQAVHQLAWGVRAFQPCTAPWTVTHTQNGNQQTYAVPGQYGFLTIVHNGAGVEITPTMQNIDF